MRQFCPVTVIFVKLATDHVLIRIPKTKGGKTQIEDYHAKEVLETYQVTPAQIIELKSLMGDTADNIPGNSGCWRKDGDKNYCCLRFY